MIVDNDLLSIQQARILAENARAAQHALASFPQERLDAIVEAMAAAVEEQAEALAVMSHEETGYGRVQDKLAKNLFVCGQVREHLRGMQCVGVVGHDSLNRIMEVGVPVGVVAILSPSTSPVSTTAYAALIAIKSGNAAIVSPHPRAGRSIARVLDIMITAATAHGLPEGCLAYMGTVTASGTQELMQHAATSMVVVAGVPRMLSAARASGKPVIFGDTGNGPAFVERSADISRAAADIIRSKTFDNGIAPAAEQSVVVDGCIAQAMRTALEAHGAYFMTEAQALCLGELFFCADGRHRAGMVGVSAEVLARRAGFDIPQNTSVLVAERKYVSEADPYSRELLSPVLAFYVEDDWMHACEKCIELLLHARTAHTLVVHSSDDEVIRQFALRKPVGRMLVNTPASLGGMGMTTDLSPSMILGSGAVGGGITADNVSPRNLVYMRRIGYGRALQDGMLSTAPETVRAIADTMGLDISNTSTLQSLHRILAEAIRVMGTPADR